MAQFQRPPNPQYGMRAAADRAEIVVYDVIGDAFGGVSARQFRADLRALGSVRSIDVRINSPGGEVSEGRAIYTALREHPARVVIHVDGMAASIASLVAMAGDDVRMADGTYMMIHNAWAWTMGDAAELRRVADRLDGVTADTARTYAARSKQDLARITEWMAAETWFGAADAVAAGLADAVDGVAKLAAMAPDALSMFRNPPPALARPRLAAATAAIERIKRAAK